MSREAELEMAYPIRFEEITQSGIYRIKGPLPDPIGLADVCISYMHTGVKDWMTYITVLTGPPARVGELWYLVDGRWLKLWNRADDSDPRKPLFSPAQEARIKALIRKEMEGDVRR